MTGLDLEPFLRLLRADLGVWISLAAVFVVLGLMAWTSWGSRRALRKCLVLSILAHVGLLLYGNGLPSTSGGGYGEESSRERIQEIRLVGDDGRPLSPDESTPSRGDGDARPVAAWDRPTDLSAPPDPALRAAKPSPVAAPPPVRTAPDRLATPSASPPDLRTADATSPDAETAVADAAPPDAPSPAPAAPEEIPAPAPPPEARVAQDPADAAPIRVRPNSAASPGTRTATVERPSLPAPDFPGAIASPSPTPTLDEPVATASADRPAPDRVADATPDRTSPRGGASAIGIPEGDLRARVRGTTPKTATGRSRPNLDPVTIARASSSGSGAGGPPLPAPSSRPVLEVPEVYRERVEPDRSARARRAGASVASEAAVERALDWLARHQDADGRWNGGTKKYRADDSPLAGEVNFTMHCPPGEVCSGECYYYEADTAMTGLALLAYLGAGYTHNASDGKHAATIARGLQYLLKVQKGDGDLRGDSLAVGMYCHAMATLAVCEAYALSGDERLRGPAERAVGFLAKSRAADGMSWRYRPGETSGDTSLLGWAILVFKSADEVGIAVPASMRNGALGWLNLVTEGKNGGLAVYRPKEGPYGGVANYVPGRNMTPTMTAEAWVCREFLGVGGPGAASDEAARYLLQNRPDRSRLNLYYWYYGTLAMFRRGGGDWDAWNGQVRDALVALQKTSGHQSGSWDPAESRSMYDARGGRIYCTALAAMTLEVYYRYSKTDPPKPPRMAPRNDPTLRRTGEPTPRR